MIAINNTCVVVCCRIALRIIAMQPRGAISVLLLDEVGSSIQKLYCIVPVMLYTTVQK